MLEIFKAILIVGGLIILIPLVVLLVGMVVAIFAGLISVVSGESLLTILFIIITIVCLAYIFS